MLFPIPLAQSLIRIPSVTPDVSAALDFLQGELRKIGFTCHRLKFTESGTPDVDNLYAVIGSGAPHFCFAGHMDVVPVGDEAAWSRPPFSGELADGMLHGRGAEDMKAAIAAFTAAAAQFLAEKKSFGRISLLITGDEEGPAINGTHKMLQWLKERGEAPDHCLVGEPTNPEKLGQMVKIGRRGSANFSLTVLGKQGHVAYPHLAENPITGLVRILDRLKSHTLDKGTDFFPPSNLEVTSIDVGNKATNVIPASATARFNVRFNDLHTSDGLRAWIEAECAKEGARYELVRHFSAEAFLTPPGEFSALVAGAVAAVTGMTPELSTTGGTSDARFIKEVCPVVEFGTTGRTPHMVNECLAVADIEKLTAVYLEVLRRYFAASGLKR